MFTRIKLPEPEAAPPLSRPAPVQPRRATVLRWVKRAIAFALVAIGASAMVTDASYVTSDNAVVTAHLVSIRAPIQGVVRGVDAVMGAPVRAGATLMELENPLVDERPVTAMQARLDRLKADLDAATSQRASLTAILDDLRARAERHKEAKLAQLALQTSRLDRDRTAKQAELEQLVRDMARKQALVGVVPKAEQEQAETAVRIAARQVQSFDQQIAISQAEEASARDGVIIEANSGNDVAYSDQRADEIRVRLVELDRTINGLMAETDETRRRLDAEKQTLQRERVAVVKSPSDGMVWRLGSALGERVAPGDMLAQIVDCRTAVLAVAVVQEQLPMIDSKAEASFRLAGEQTFRTGHILAITGEAAVRADGNLAAMLATSNRPTGSVLISVPPSPDSAGACLVGRSAHVLLPAVSETWLERVRRWLPVNLPGFGPRTVAPPT